MKCPNCGKKMRKQPIPATNDHEKDYEYYCPHCG